MTARANAMSRNTALPLRIKIEKPSQVLTPPQAHSDRSEPENRDTAIGQPQCNNDATAHGLHIPVIKLGNSANVPAAKQQDQPLHQMQPTLGSIHNQLEEINTHFDAINAHLGTMDTRLDAMNNNLTGLGTRQDASSHNACCVHENGYVRHKDAPLMALHHRITNKRIPNFPATPADILRLSGAQLSRLLANLGAPVGSSRKDKMDLLRKEIGLRL